MRKADNATVRANNRALILNSLSKGPLSRAEIVAGTGLSKAAVTSLVNEAIECGELYEIGAQTTGNVGRPSVKVDIVSNYKFVIGFALHRKTLSVCIVDLKSNPCFVKVFETKDFDFPQNALDRLFDEAFIAVKRLNIKAESILGIGISCPGPLDYKIGKVLNPLDFELFWDFNIKDYLRTKTDMPVFLDNNAVLLALREELLFASEFKNGMFAVCADGIGSAILYKGNVLRGSNGFAGELGHISVETDGEICSCGNTGCLERYLSLSRLKIKFGFSDYNSVVKDYRKGIEKAKETVNYISRTFSKALVSAVNLLDLDGIILYGELNDKYGITAKLIENEIYKRSIIIKTHKVTVKSSKLKEDSNILCSCCAVIKAYYDQRI